MIKTNFKIWFRSLLILTIHSVLVFASEGRAWKDRYLLYLKSFEHDGTQQCDAAILDVCVISLTLKQRWQRSEKREFITAFPLGPGSVHTLVALQRGHLLWACALPFHRLFCPTIPFFFFFLLFLRGTPWAFWMKCWWKLLEMSQSFWKVSFQGLWY